MGLVETEGLVLKSYSLAEADKIVVILTRDDGLVRGVAKGAKRLKSRFGGGLEPFTVVRVEYDRKEERELVSLRQVELVRSYFSDASSPEFLTRFAYLIDTLIEFAPPHDPAERLYRMTRVCLEAAADSPESLLAITVYFELWLLKLGGFLPDWGKCGRCGGAIQDAGGCGVLQSCQLACADCSSTAGGSTIGSRERELVLHAQNLSPKSFLDAAFGSDRELDTLSRIFKSILSRVLGREIPWQASAGV